MDDASFVKSIISMIAELQDNPDAVAILNDPATGPETNLFDSGLLRSLSVVRLLRALEEHFNVHVPVERYGMEAFFTIRSIQQMVKPLLAPEDRISP